MIEDTFQDAIGVKAAGFNHFRRFFGLYKFIRDA
jgi:hypothetical protein